MATVRCNAVIESAGTGSQNFRAEVLNRILTLTSNVVYCQKFALAATTTKVFYDRSLTDAFQSTVGAGQCGMIIVDPDNVYDDGDTEPEKIIVNITISDSSNANTVEQTKFRARREVPHLFSTLEWATALTSDPPTRLLNKVEIRNNGSSTVGVMLVLFG